MLLSNLLKRKVEGFLSKEKVLPDEYEFVHQAVFTDPDDQSGWFYHLWLLDQTVKLDSPQLVSSWPLPGSDLTLLGNRCLDGSASPFTRFYSDSGTFPLILYFNQAVEGVNLSTITVDSEVTSNKALVWKPLSTVNSQASQVWATQLNFSNVKTDSSKAYPVEVSLGHSQGIISSNGFRYGKPSRFTFRVCAQHVETKPAEELDRERILWRDEDFHLYDTHSQESSPIVLLDQLSINNDHESTDSEWRAAVIAKEIDHFRELLSLINW